jgi:hypothetical protein
MYRAVLIRVAVQVDFTMRERVAGVALAALVSYRAVVRRLAVSAAVVTVVAWIDQMACPVRVGVLVTRHFPANEQAGITFVVLVTVPIFGAFHA